MVQIKGSDDLIVQVVQTVISGVISLSTTTGSWQNIPSLTASITPTSASSKILVRVNVQVGHNSMGNMTTRLLRGATPIGVGTAISSALQGSFGLTNRAESNLETVNRTFEFMDSPSTTSSVTYSLQNYNNWDGSQCYLGRTYNAVGGADDGTYPSVMTLMEIRG